ncbi:MAG TPA: biotin-dependent carboxyltransferase family protein [Alphaproteobacteria bacterium]|nr:biotin-dependent carboxyltransferase family protein [Alphaproteobacteria bacterium]
MTGIRIIRAGPLCTVQDNGRFGMLRHGVSASGPMDRAAFERAAAWLGAAGSAGLEFTQTGIAFAVEDGEVAAAFEGADFTISHNGKPAAWRGRLLLAAGDVVEITPGTWGNYGYVRFDRELDVPCVMGSQATNTVAALGGRAGRSLAPGDRIGFGAVVPPRAGLQPRAAVPDHAPIRVLWGLHADVFPAQVRERFASEAFTISPHLNRMGARLEDRAGVFEGQPPLTLVSDAVVPGDVQVLGDGTPIVLLRDHQPTGGYARIATVISADLDRFVQLRPGTEVRFRPVTLQHAHAILKGRER